MFEEQIVGILKQAEAGGRRQPRTIHVSELRTCAYCVLPARASR